MFCFLDFDLNCWVLYSYRVCHDMTILRLTCLDDIIKCMVCMMVQNIIQWTKCKMSRRVKTKKYWVLKHFCYFLTPSSWITVSWSPITGCTWKTLSCQLSLFWVVFNFHLNNWLVHKFPFSSFSFPANCTCYNIWRARF